jgi:hypothetical protein
MPPVLAVRTRFSALTPLRAGLVLAVLLAVTGALLLVALDVRPLPGVSAGEVGDMGTYAKVVERLRSGESYHPALQRELIDGGYGSRSLFNWRPPFHLSALAVLPSPLWAQLVMVLAGFAAAMLAAASVLRSHGPLMAAAVAVALVLSLAALGAPGMAFAIEVAAGTLLLLSVAAYGMRLPWLGFVAAVLALLVRVLAAVYVLVAIAIAWRERRYAELWAWVVALGIYGAYFLWHAGVVFSLIGAADKADPSSWLQFGGAGFLLLAAAYNGAFLLLPLWVTALVLPLGVLGLLAWPGAMAGRALATVLAYLVFFAIIGKPFNGYWGGLFTPLLTLGLPWAPLALRDLAQALGPAPLLGRSRP